MADYIIYVNILKYFDAVADDKLFRPPGARFRHQPWIEYYTTVWSMTRLN